MSRTELARILDSLVKRKRITRAEADQMLATYDAGDFEQLPEEPQDDRGQWLAAFALLLLLVRGSARRGLTPRRSQQARRLLRANFDSRMRSLAGQVTSGAITVPVWQEQVQEALASYTRQMAIAGRGRMPGAQVQARIDERLSAQWDYLRRFSVEQLARGTERPMSAAYIANRARSYGATAWGAYFEAQGEGAGPGVVDQWVSRDDDSVCRVCAPRHLQFFLPGEGPMPGWDCLGACRCVRSQIYAPEIYAELTGQRRQAA